MTTYNKILKLLEKPEHQQLIDDLVHEAASREATRVNNEGTKAQLRFLESCGWDDEDVLQHLEEAANA